MARKNKDQAEKKVLFARLQQVWTDISYTDWLLLVSELKPEAQFTRHGAHIKGRCPFHDDPRPSFVITPSKGLVKCFGCHRSWFGPIHFIADLRGCSFGDAILFVRKRFGLKASIPEALYEKVRDFETYQRAKGKIGDFLGAQLLEAIAAWPNLEDKGLSWAEPAVKFLLGRRLGENAPGELRPAGEERAEGADPYNIWPTICSNQLLGVLPPKATVANQFGQDSEEYKFFCSYFSTYVNEGYKFVGFLVFMFHFEPSPAAICRFKLRSPHPSPQKEMFFVDDAYEAEMGGFRGFFGLNYFRTFLGLTGPDSHSYVDTTSITEGEFDALAPIAQQIRRQSDDSIVLALGGASAQPVDRLLNFGVERVQIIADRDRGGVNFTRRVLEETKTPRISFSMFRWPEEYVTWRDQADPTKRIKDPDEAIGAMGYPKWARHVADRDSYAQPHEWCFEQASVEISRTAAEDVRQRGRAAMDWGRLLKDAQECSHFCRAVEKHFELDYTILYRDIRAKDENEEAFIERLCDKLKEHFHLVGVQHIESRRRMLVLWNKDSRAIDSIVLNDEKSVETVLSRYFGTLYDFIRDQVGDPAFLAPEGEEAAFSVTMRVKKYREYLTFALLKLSQGLPSMENSPMKAQGFHAAHHADGVLNSYMVNGRDVFHITHADDGGYGVRVLDGPSHGGTVFDNSGEPWLHSVHKAEDLTADPVDLPALYLSVKRMIDTGWSFRYQALDSSFLAAYILCIPVMSVFTRQTAIIVNAEHESGKSRFTSGLIGGTGFPRINIVAHALSMQGYTAASIRQQRNNSTLCLCLEEFEDYGTNDAKSVTVRKVLELTRDLISESAVNWSIGTTTGESRTYHLRFPLVACAIRPLRDAASLSRFVSFELVKDPKRIDPVIALLEEFKDEGIHSVRHQVAVGPLRHVGALRRLQVAVEREYANGARLPAHASSRFREAMYPVLTMLKLLHDLSPATMPDYQRFAYDFAESRREQLARLKTTSENEQIFETVLSSAIQIDNSDDRRSWTTTIRIMLADMNKLDEINKTKKGVYFDKKMDWLVVSWIEACQGVLANSKYKAETPTFLKQVSERSPFHVPTEQVRQANVLERLVDDMGPCQPIDLITVFSVKHLLAEARARRESALAQSTTLTTAAVAGDKPQGVGDIVA